MLIFAAILAIFVYGMIAAMLGTILPELSDRFHLTPTQNGTIAFAQALGLMIASLGVGPLLDTQGDKIGLILGLVFIAIALLRCRAPAVTAASCCCCSCSAWAAASWSPGPMRWSTAWAGASQRNRAEPGESVLRAGRPDDAVHLGESVPPQLGAALLYRRRAHYGHHRRSRRPSHACARPGRGLCSPRRARFWDGRCCSCWASCFSCMSPARWACGTGWPRHLIAQGIPESRALNILSLGFALGLLVGRVAVSPILIHVPAVARTLAASIAMAMTTFLMLRTSKPGPAAALVFIAGLAMAPVFPTTLAITGTAFPHTDRARRSAL